MKKLILTFFILLISLKGFCQFEGKIKLFVTDSLGKVDSVLIGMENFATIGIDSSLGEINIYGIPYKDLDIRIIQRDSASFNCLYKNGYTSNNKIIFPENIDSKINIREFSWPDKSFNHFEIKINAVNYPLTISADLSNFNSTIFSGSAGWSPYFILNKNCQSIQQEQINVFNQKTLKIADTSITTLIFQFDVHAGIEENSFSSDKNFNIYPNPFTDQIQIESKNLNATKYQQLKICNSLGQIVKTELISSTQNVFNLNNLKPGIYFLEIEESNHIIYRQKIIKH